MIINMDFFLRLPVYIFELVFFVVITRMCFFEKYSLKGIAGSVLFSPVSSVLFSNIFALTVLEPFSEYSTQSIVFYSMKITLFQTVFQLVLLVGYVKFVKAKNPSIALFLFLCYYQMVPNFLIVSLLNTSILSYLLPAVLVVAFYFVLAKPLSKITRTRIVTDTKLFVVLPVLTSLYNAFMLAMILVISCRNTMTDNDIRLFAENLKKVADDETRAYMRDLLRSIIEVSIGNFADLLYYSVLFMTLILIIAFVVIVKNIEYLNETIKARDKIHELSVEVMETLAHTIDAKDQYTKGHSTRVAKYARMIAEKMGLDKEKQDDIYYMGLLHDIGKIAIPKEIINKPAPLSDEEYKLIQTHPATGYSILSEMKSRPDLAIGAKSHHERIDGKGYPEKLTGDKIPIEARIIAVADAYDAMSSNRSYRAYLPQEKVRQEIIKNIGTQFDEVPAKCMLAIMEEDKDYQLHE